MDVFAVEINYEIYILADSAVDAEKAAAILCEDAEVCMPDSQKFRYTAFRTYNQSAELKAKAVNNIPF